MIEIPFDLDSIDDKLNKFRNDCAALALECVRAAIEAGVPANDLWQYTPDADRNVEWNAVPGAYRDYIEFTGEVWRHSDTDYVEFRVPRQVLEGDMTPENWGDHFKVHYDVMQAAKMSAEQEQIEERKRQQEDARRVQYEELRKEFGDA